MLGKNKIKIFYLLFQQSTWTFCLLQQSTWTVYCSFSFSHDGLWLFIIVNLDFVYYSSQCRLCTVVVPLVITDFVCFFSSQLGLLFITVVNVDCVLQFFLQSSRTLIIYYSQFGLRLLQQSTWTVYCSFSFSHHGLWLLFQQSTQTFVYYSSQRGLCTVVFHLVITNFGYLLQSTWTLFITVVNVDCVLQSFLQSSQTLVIYQPDQYINILFVLSLLALSLNYYYKKKIWFYFLQIVKLPSSRR